MAKRDAALMALKCRIPGLRKRGGRAHELAWEGQKQDHAWTLVHGALRKTPEGYQVASHAWLVHEASQMVYDPVVDLLTTQADYRQKFQPLPAAQYTFFEALYFAAHFGHMGPWHGLVSAEEFSKLIYEAIEAKRRIP